MAGLGETAWVDRNLGLAWSRIAKAVPKEEWLPVVAEERTGRAKVAVQEYGCGHYGCVMPTYDSNVVMKLTSDETEAAFVAAALTLDDEDAWHGMVEYYDIYRLKAAFHRRRPLYVIWREAAHNVGLVELQDAMKDDHRRRSLRELSSYLDKFQWSADKVREQLKRARAPYALIEKAVAYENWAWANVDEVEGDPLRSAHTWKPPAWVRGLRGAQGVAAHLRHCQLIAELMAHTYLASDVGSALGYYLENGLLLADVHGNNIGQVTREDFTSDPVVITDPGHAVPLIERWAELEIEEI